ncbi:MAG: four helix bundle protein [Bacteroidia bacterium]|nr:MAG: four helix bundle protein [Bacteroidia bacterium]
MIEKNIILDNSFSFALNIIQYCELLEKHRKYVISKQLLRSGTSIGASVREAQNAESSADFCHKMKIASKEAEETDYWLLLCESSANYPTPGGLLNEINSIKKLLGKIISTVKKRSPK